MIDQEPRRDQLDAEDTAAVIAVLSALAGGDDEPTESPRDVWGSPAHRLGIVRPGPHGWWAAGQPR